MAAKIRCDDEVIIITGKDKGQRSKVKKILSTGKAILAGMNMINKHQKPVPSINQPGCILKQEAAIDISNIAIFNTDIGKADRVVFKIVDGKKIRVFKSNSKPIK